MWRLAGLGCCAALACTPPSSRCGDGSPEVGVFCFPDQEVVRMGHGFAPEAMMVIDVDGDGLLDLAAVNPATETLSVAWGDGDGTFTRLTSWPIGGQVAGLACADLDGDGTIDLATARPDADAVTVLYQRGRRSFEPRMHAAGDTPRNVLAAALVAGEPAALVTANIGDGTLSVLRRGFAGAPVIVGPAPHGLAAADVDGDGSLDIAVTLREADAVQVMHMMSGVLVPGELHAVGAVPGALVAADLDEDGIVDLASADELGDTVSVIFGDGAGGARETWTWPVGPQPIGLAVVRGDALAPALGVLSKESFVLQQLDPRSGELASAGTRVRPSALAAGDVDGVGREALLLGGAARASSVTPGAGIRFTPRWTAPGASVGTPVDVGGDGIDELVITREGGDLVLWRGPGDVVTAQPWPSGLRTIDDLVRADMTGDGLEDLVVLGIPPGSTETVLGVLVQDSAGFRPWAQGPVVDADRGALVVGDVGGDGTMDVLFSPSDRNAPDGIFLFAGDGTGQLGAAQRITEEKHIIVRAADLDGDAALDLVASAPERDGLVVFEDIAVGVLPRLLPVSHYVRNISTGDLTGDGLDELLACTDDGLVLTSADTGLSIVSPAFAEYACEGSLMRDLDADGDLDVLVVVRDTVQRDSAWAYMVVLVNDGAGGLSVAGQPGISSDVTAILPMATPEGPSFAAIGAESLEVLGFGPGPVLFEAPRFELGGGGFGRLADLDGDGRQDWVNASRREVAVSFGQTGGMGPTHYVAAAGLLDADVTALASSALADLDDDGTVELVTLGVVDDAATLPLRSLSVVRFEASGEVSGAPIVRLAGEASAVHARDVDDDGAVDLLLLEQREEVLVVTRLRGEGDGRFAGAVSQQLAASEIFGDVELADIDGDRRLDLVMRGNGLLMAAGQGGGDFDAPRPWFSSHFLLGDGVFADFDGDRKTDLVVAGGWGVLMLRGDGTRASGPPRHLLYDGHVLALAASDLDGDGSRELLVVTQTVDGRLLWTGRNPGDGRFVFHSRRLPGWSDLFLLDMAVRDMDGDGALDVVIQEIAGMTIVRQRP